MTTITEEYKKKNQLKSKKKKKKQKFSVYKCVETVIEIHFQLSTAEELNYCIFFFSFSLSPFFVIYIYRRKQKHFVGFIYLYCKK